MKREEKTRRSRRYADDEDAPMGLDDVIRERLSMFSKDNQRTRAEALADALIEAAIGGDLKSLDMLSRRVGKAPDAPVDAAAADVDIDDEIARRILEAARGSVKSRTHD